MSRTTVNGYIQAAPADQRSALTKIRALIREHLPRARESMGPNGFPVYTDGNARWIAGFAWRKKGPVLYVMNAGVVDRYAERLGRLRSGKSCIDWRATKVIPIQELTTLADRMLGEAAMLHRARAPGRPRA